ncbi:addiction module toxin, HicA family [bacterium]|nr:addiction module toxin, HicA family [bacterium]
MRVLRISGSHHIPEKSGEPKRIIVPVHAGQTLKIGLENAILKQAKLK